MLDYLRALWTTNPVRVISTTTTLILACAAALGVALDEATVSATLAAVIPVVLGAGELARAQVTPWQGEVGPPNDELLPLEQAPAP